MVKSIEGKHPEYYEAILQLRNVNDLVVHFVKMQIKKENIYLSKIKAVVNGFDFYLADYNFTRALSKKLQQQFNGHTLITASLVGRKKDKDIHRFTVLFRGTDFKKGDKVEYNGENYVIRGVGKEIQLQPIDPGKKVNVKWKDSKEIKKKAGALLIK